MKFANCLSTDLTIPTFPHSKILDIVHPVYNFLDQQSLEMFYSTSCIFRFSKQQLFRNFLLYHFHCQLFLLLQLSNFNTPRNFLYYFSELSNPILSNLEFYFRTNYNFPPLAILDFSSLQFLDLFFHIYFPFSQFRIFLLANLPLTILK